MDERAPLPETPKRPDPGRVLLLVPHADDDVIGVGGTMALHVEQGDRVTVLVVFDGVAGDPEGRYEVEELRQLRQREARAGGAHLGLDDYLFWGYPEGHEPGPPEFAVAVDRLAALIDELAPKTIYAPWIGEYHLDHHVLARVARGAVARARFAGDAWGYEVWTPLIATRIVDITELRERKVAALREHASQLEYTDHIHKALGLQAQRSLYLPGSALYGEAFAPLGPPSEADRALLGL